MRFYLFISYIERIYKSACCFAQSLHLCVESKHDISFLCRIADGPLFRDDPVVNLCHGLNTHCLWYEAAVAENMKQDVTQVRADSEGRSSGPHEFIGETEAPEPSVGVSSRPTENRLLREGSPEGSIISSDSHFYRSAGQQSERASQLAVDFEVSLWEASQRSIYEETNDEGFVEDGEQVWLKASIPLTAGIVHPY